MKILQLTPAPQGTFLVHDSGQKRPVFCFALISREDGSQVILPCVSGSLYGLAVYTKDDAKVIL